MTGSDDFLVVALSGSIGSGKTTFAKLFAERNRALVVTTRELILKKFPTAARTRVNLQRLGDQLDNESGGKWIADGVEAMRRDFEIDLQLSSETPVVVVDAIRTNEQQRWLRAIPKAVIFHLHLAASDKELASRFNSRNDVIDVNLHYEDVRLNRKEAGVFGLAATADFCLDTEQLSPLDLVLEIETHLAHEPRFRHVYRSR